MADYPSNPLENSTIAEDLIKKQLKKVTIKFIISISISVLLAVFFIVYVLFLNKRDFEYEKDYKKEMKILQRDLDSLKKNRLELNARADKIVQELADLDTYRDMVDVQLAEQENRLSNIKKNYAKINSYTGVSSDSLRRLFADRFGH